MATAIYILWGLVPVFFFCILCISSLEKYFGKKKTEKPGDFLRSFLFTTACYALFAFVDYTVLDFLYNDIAMQFFPRNALLFLTYPILLWIGAKCIGGSEEIRVSRAPGKK